MIKKVKNFEISGLPLTGGGVSEQLRFFYELQQIAWDTFMSLAAQVFKDNPYAVSVVEWSDSFHTTINCFLPLNELLGVLTVLLTVWVTCLIIKVTLKLIPTIY
jgi:hypothetical protein